MIFAVILKQFISFINQTNTHIYISRMKTTPILLQASSPSIPTLPTSGNERKDRMLQRRKHNIFPVGLMMFSPLHHQWGHESLGVTHQVKRISYEQQIISISINYLHRNLNWNWRVSCLWDGMEWHALAWVPCTRSKQNNESHKHQLNLFLDRRQLCKY